MITFDRAQLATLLVASVGALAAITSAVLSALNARAATRREWARARLADTYAEVIRAAHVVQEVVGNLAGEELTSDETEPENAPHYAWSTEDQQQLDEAHSRIARAFAEMEMFSPAYVVAAARELNTRVWFAQSYHRLAYEQEILERSSADYRASRITQAINVFVDAVRRDLGVATAPALRRTLRCWAGYPRMLLSAYRSRGRQREAHALQASSSSSSSDPDSTAPRRP